MKQPSNKEVVKRLYNEYKEQYLNEIFETPLEFKQIDSTKYQAGNLAIFTFKREYDFSSVPFDTTMYKIPFYWGISWIWINDISEEEKTIKNWLKVTSTSFKIIDDFIRQKDYPPVLEFSGQTQTHKNVYHSVSFCLSTPAGILVTHHFCPALSQSARGAGPYQKNRKIQKKLYFLAIK